MLFRVYPSSSGNRRWWWRGGYEVVLMVTSFRLGLGRHIVENSHVGTSIRTPIKNTIMYGAQPHSAVNEEQQRRQ